MSVEIGKQSTLDPRALVNVTFTPGFTCLKHVTPSQCNVTPLHHTEPCGLNVILYYLSNTALIHVLNRLCPV